MKTTRTYLPETRSAVEILGAQIGAARRELGWTAAQLADRVGVTANLIGRIERGTATGTAIGTVLEAAVVCGVALFGFDPADPLTGATRDEESRLGRLAQQQRDRLALLPRRTMKRTELEQVDDDF